MATLDGYLGIKGLGVSSGIKDMATVANRLEQMYSVADLYKSPLENIQTVLDSKHYLSLTCHDYLKDVQPYLQDVATLNIKQQVCSLLDDRLVLKGIQGLNIDLTNWLSSFDYLKRDDLLGVKSLADYSFVWEQLNNPILQDHFDKYIRTDLEVVSNLPVSNKKSLYDLCLAIMEKINDTFQNVKNATENLDENKDFKRMRVIVLILEGVHEAYDIFPLQYQKEIQCFVLALLILLAFYGTKILIEIDKED